MFGYIIPDHQLLSDEAKARYRTAYCGLCRRIGALHGFGGRLTLSYDLTFLNLLLCSLYEGETTCVQECGHCPVHPIGNKAGGTADPPIIVPTSGWPSTTTTPRTNGWTTTTRRAWAI